MVVIFLAGGEYIEARKEDSRPYKMSHAKASLDDRDACSAK